MKALSIARKTLLEAWREPKLFGLLLVFPALLVIIYYVAYGQGNQGLAQALKILIVNQDSGAVGPQLVEALQKAEFDGKPVFAAALVADRREAEIPLQERKASLLLIIPPDFSQRLLADHTAAPTDPALLQMIGDTTSDMYNFASSFVMAIADDLSKQQIGWQKPQPLTLDFVSGTGTLTDFQFGIPGLLVFGVMFSTISSATLLVREDSRQTLRRLRLTQAKAADVIIGITLAHMVLAAIQLPLTFIVAQVFGFKSPGSLALALGIGMLLSITAIGMGLIAACFARSDGDAVNLGTVFMMPLVFLSGAIFPLPPVPIASLAGRAISLYDIMPTTHAAAAMRQVLIYGESPSAITYELIGLTVLSVLYLGLGVVFYQRLKLRKLAR